MSTHDKVTYEGEVIECLPNLQFLVKFQEWEQTVRCYLGGKMKINHISVNIGDWVVIDNLAPDRSIGRIIKRK